MWNDKPIRRYQSFTVGLQKLGVEPLIVLDYRSTKHPTKDLQETVALQLKRFPTVKYWQLENEVDQPDSPSSHYMLPHEYRDWLREVVPVFDGSDKVLLSAGLVSGNPNYLAEVGYYPFHKLCIHPYGQYPQRKNPMWNGWGFGDVGDLLDSYMRLGLGLGLWVTEFGIPSGGFSDTPIEDVRLRQLYYEDMLVEMSDYGVEAALPYCYSCEQCQELALKGMVNI